MADKTRGLLLLLLVFAAGALAGGAVDRAYTSRASEQTPRARVEAVRRAENERDADRIPTPLLALNLTSQEEARLREIARKWRPQAGVVLEEIQQRVRSIENDMFAEMLCVLTDEQRTRYLRTLEEGQADHVLIDKRFSLVRSGGCAKAVPKP